VWIRPNHVAAREGIEGGRSPNESRHYSRCDSLNHEPGPYEEAELKRWLTTEQVEERYWEDGRRDPVGVNHGLHGIPLPGGRPRWAWGANMNNKAARKGATPGECSQS